MAGGRLGVHHLLLAVATATGSFVGADTPPSLPPCYVATVSRFSQKPVVSSVDGSSDFAQVFNPSWIAASPGTSGKEGLLMRTQNCTGCGTKGNCCKCSGTGQKASVMTFAELHGEDGDVDKVPSFAHVTNKSVVFAPVDKNDERGDEDPRVAYDSSSGIYYMLYTCYGNGKPPVTMCLATATDPTRADSWVRHGPLGFGQDSKSGAMLIRDEGPHFLYWGAGQIHLTQSTNLTSWEPGSVFITETAWGNPLVEAGPPPMRLSNGDYIFFHNSWNKDFPAAPGYQPAWVILSGKDPTKIIARAQKPLFSPQARTWLEGKPPYTCNVANVGFLEAAHPIGGDAFRIYFGGADAVIGTAVVKISMSSTSCELEPTVVV